MTYTVEWGFIKTRFDQEAPPSPPMNLQVAAGGISDALAQAEKYLRMGYIVLSIKDDAGQEVMDYDEVWHAVFCPAV